MADEIQIAGLELTARIGACPGEKDRPQRLTATLTLVPAAGFGQLGDRLANAVDYAVAAEIVRGIAAGAAPDLLETMAEQIAAALLDRLAVAAVTVELRKYVLSDAAHVAVRLTRHR